MRVSELGKNKCDFCVYCQQALCKTSTLMYCKDEDEHLAGTTRLNYNIENGIIIELELEIYKVFADETKGKFLVVFNFQQGITTIIHNCAEEVTIDKIIDLDLTKITYEGLRDILPFI